MSTELAVANNTLATQAVEYFMPVVDVSVALARRKAVEAFAVHVMVAGTDYGSIPGAGDKKVLLKAGAEKLAAFFGMVPDFTITHAVLDFDGHAEGNGEPLIYYRVRCDLYRGSIKVGAGDASCTSRESKYRWRNAARVCPQCGQAAIIKGKAEYGGGWLCFKKNGGCGAKFNENDAAITEQPTGRTPNPDIADLDNTILKMAEKRALVAATLIATNVSDFFTQDMDDFADVEIQSSPVVAPRRVAQQPVAQQPEPPVWADWRNGTDAIEYAVLQGVDKERAAAEYQALKDALKPKKASDMFAAWLERVPALLEVDFTGSEQPALVVSGDDPSLPQYTK